MLDLKAQYQTIRDEVLEAVERVFEDQAFVLGEEVDGLEREIAAYCGTSHAVGCASGTDALILALMALDVKPGDKVLTVPFTFFATVSCITRIGATPVFVDILSDTFNMDPQSLERALQRHRDAKAILPVHLFGACADMDAIHAVAARYGVPVVEDACQSIGAEYKGRRAGSMGIMGCFSFFPSKNLGGCGDGGIITTNDAALAERLKALRVHGARVKYYHDEVGLNSRLDALQATVLRVKLKRLDEWSDARAANAELYTQALAAAVGSGIRTPAVAPHSSRHVYNQYTILTPRRDEVKARLELEGIQSEIYYPLSLHLQKCFSYLGYGKGDLPVSEAVSAECLSLPMYPELAAGEIRRVASAVAGAL